MKLVKENWRLILLGVCACACTFLVNLARPYQNWIESYRCTLSISDGKVWVDASMIGSQSCDESSIHVFLEEKVNGEWVEVRLWSDVQEGFGRRCPSLPRPLPAGSTGSGCRWAPHETGGFSTNM